MSNTKRILITLLLFIVLGIVFSFWWNQGLAPVNATDKTNKIFIVKKGAGIREIANNLKKDNLIKDPVVFFLLVKRLGLDSKIQAGDFRFSPSESATDIAKGLTTGTLDIWITIPEGKRADEIADILKANIPTYQESWREALQADEGYLFPDTYLIPRDADITLIRSLLKNTFEMKYAESLAKARLKVPGGTEARAQNPQTKLTKTQIITIASMIEREARFVQDRPLVASVILNRLDIGMALQIDATVQYALGYQPATKTWWKKELTFDDLKLASPYNTYTHTTLPPTPISNPGIDAIRAVISPANTNYLYYISDKSGNNHYARTLEEHNANIKKYGLQ